MTPYDLKHSVHDRLKFLQEFHGFETEKAFADAIGITLDSLKGILKRDGISWKNAMKIAKAFNCELAWVKEGRGSAEKSTPRAGEEGWPSEAEAEKDAAEAAAMPVPPLRSVDPEEFAYIPKTRSKLAAGHGLIPDNEEYTERFAFRRVWLKSVSTGLSKVLLMEVDGDSMYPTLRTGDTVLIDVGRTEVHGGGIYAFSSDDFILIKRLEWVSGGLIRIISDNPIYPPEERPAADIRIIGRCIWFGRTLL